MAKKKPQLKVTSSGKKVANKKALSAYLKNKPRCGLCGKTENLTKTECCDNWICNDAANYTLFSYAKNSCYRNHSRYTLCAYHHNEQHEGSSQDCQKCLTSNETEMYVWYGTNEFNFEVLKNPPKYEPTRCSVCRAVIVLPAGGYMMRGDDYFCERCSAKQF